MAIPIAHFEYSILGLVVTFSDTSLNSPTSWLWDFGDSTGSTEQNPVKTYTQEGVYDVSLIATNLDGSSNAFSATLDLIQSESSFSPISTPILKIIDFNIPSALTGEATLEEKQHLIAKWQLYLQPLVEEPTTVDIADTHDESAWPSLVNSLIGQLCAMDIILQGANQFLSLAGSAGGTTTTTTTGSGSSNSATEQQLKSIETGPAKVEYYENKDSSNASTSEVIKNIGDAYSSATKAGGALDQLKQSICQLASRLRINLPVICGELSYSPTPIQIGRPTLNTYNTDPYANGISN